MSHVNDVSWLDFGTAKHMTGYRHLVDMEISFGDGGLVSANEATYELQGKGSIALRMLDGQIRSVIKVWFVPSVKKKQCGKLPNKNF